MNPQKSGRFSRLQSTAFYLLLATAVLAPLSFWASPYFALEAVKTLVIGVLTMATLVVLLILAIREREFRLPPTSIAWIGVIMSVSVVLSSIGSGHFVKSFFGQGFEISAGSFIVTLILASMAAFAIAYRRVDSVIILYSGLVASFLVLWVFHALRLVFGINFASLGILGSPTSSIFGSWFSLGIFAVVITIVSFLAIKFLSLSRKMVIAYWVLFGLSALTVLVVNTTFIWQVCFVTFLGLTIYLSSQRTMEPGNLFRGFLKRLEILPLVFTILALLFAWKGAVILGPMVSKMNAGHAELSLPWTVTMDIASGELKQNPLFGAGPNRFGQTYLTYKPTTMNLTDAWSVEFNSGFGFIPTLLITHGFVGGIIWVLFFIFFGILGVRSLRGLVRGDETGILTDEPMKPYAKFILISSYASAAFLWLSAMVYVPSHAVMYIAFLMTGIWLGASVAYGRLSSINLVRTDSRVSLVLPVVQMVLIVVFVLWGITYIKNAAALGYFGSGVRQLNDTSSVTNPEMADAKFARAASLNPLDIYWQARAEAGLAIVKNVLATITSTTTATQSEEIAKNAASIVNKSLDYANKAVESDDTNYNNYISQARVSEVASAMRMANAYDSAVRAYTNAIRHNTQSPSIYLSLAKLQASQNQYDAAIQTIGAVLQIKNNYLDAVFLLSQIEAAKGNLPDAIIAAQFATQLNPQNPLLFFQLGLLQYTKGDYTASANSMNQALTLEANYSNALYFLGLSAARLGRTEDAINAFQKLALANPENKDVSQILTTLRAGKSLFTTPPVPAARAEKRSQPPIPVK